MGNRESILEQIKVFALENSGFLPVGIQYKLHSREYYLTTGRRAGKQLAKGSYSGGQKDISTWPCVQGDFSGS